MKMSVPCRILLLTALLVVSAAPAARAQVAGVEVGTSVMTLGVSLRDDNFTSFTMPGGSGLYASFLVAPRIAIEAQVGLSVFSARGQTNHTLSLGGQAVYFFDDSKKKAPFVFGGAGLANGYGSTPVSFWGGAGYRIPLGDRLVGRVDVRVTHSTENGGTSLGMTVSLGGLFGRR